MPSNAEFCHRSLGIHHQWSLQFDCKREMCGWKDLKGRNAWRHLLPFIQDEKGIISVQVNAGKVTQTHQED